ncbi:MAG: ATP-binding cassette domain-containing protein [Acidobacteriota bacterium]
MLELDDVSKRFETAGSVSTLALDGVSLSVPAGRTLTLLGPSGCGKSTLLRVMIGLIAPDTGVVRVDGQALTTVSAAKLRRRMGYVIQDGGLFPHLTAHGNLALQARHFGWSEARIDARVAELLELTRFPVDGLERYPTQLSGGQRQRVSLMRALMLDPDVLLLDEPLGALDPIIRSDLQRDLAAIFTRLEKTVVLVTHDLAEAAYLGHCLVLMHRGRIVQQGSFEDLDESPAEPFVTRFLSAQRMLHAVSSETAAGESP